MCSVCSYANDAGFKFCQSCGHQSLQETQESNDYYLTGRRLSYLDSLIDNSAYSRKKSALQKEFEKFLLTLGTLKTIFTATPNDVRSFLVEKDKKGRTQVHVIECEHLGKLGIFPCSCPCRLSAGTVQSVIGQLNSIFQNLGRGNSWHEESRSGNPSASGEVHKYLKAVRLEQSKSHVSSKQAKPLFLVKLRKLSDHLDKMLHSDLSMSERFVILRDQAFFKTLFFAGDRANDLGLTLTQEIKKLSDGKGFFFCHTVGKTLGNGKVNEFSIMRLEDISICPVHAIEFYVQGAKGLGISLNTGYLFRTLDSTKKIMTDNPVTSSSMGERLKMYLLKLGIFEGETTHSFKAGCAITLALSGSLQEDIMSHVGWSSSSSFERYSRYSKMVGRNSVGQIMANVVKDDPNTAKHVFEGLGNTTYLNSAF